MPIYQTTFEFELDPNNRISRVPLNLSIAHLISLRSFCQRAKVGCIITSPDHRIISTGYNGTLSESCMGICDPNLKCSHAIHAEANAISFAARNGIPLSGSFLYCTHSPCYECAKLIIQAGISKVIFSQKYRLTEGIDLLEKHSIPVIHHVL